MTPSRAGGFGRAIYNAVQAAVSLALLVASVLYLWPSTEQALGHCRQEALKSFGHLRKANDYGFRPFQTELEDRYVEECMSLRGFKLDREVREGQKGDLPLLGQVGSEDRSLWMMDERNWKRATYWPTLR